MKKNLSKSKTGVGINNGKYPTKMSGGVLSLCLNLISMVAGLFLMALYANSYSILKDLGLPANETIYTLLVAFLLIIIWTFTIMSMTVGRRSYKKNGDILGLFGFIIGLVETVIWFIVSLIFGLVSSLLVL